MTHRSDALDDVFPPEQDIESREAAKSPSSYATAGTYALRRNLYLQKSGLYFQNNTADYLSECKTDTNVVRALM